MSIRYSLMLWQAGFRVEVSGRIFCFLILFPFCWCVIVALASLAGKFLVIFLTSFVRFRLRGLSGCTSASSIARVNLGSWTASCILDVVLDLVASTASGTWPTGRQRLEPRLLGVCSLQFQQHLGPCRLSFVVWAVSGLSCPSRGTWHRGFNDAWGLDCWTIRYFPTVTLCIFDSIVSYNCHIILLYSLMACQ